MALKVLLTGGSGHIGFHVAQALLARGYHVHLLLRRPNVLTERLARRGAVVHVVDLLAPDTYRHLFHADGLFHLAASNTTSQSNADATRASTAGLAQVVIGAAIAARVPKIVYTSSVVVLGRSPDAQRLINEDDATSSAESPYVAGKVEAEEFCLAQRRRGADIRIVYPSWVVGPDDPKCTPPHKLILDFVKKGQRFYFAGGISIAHVTDVAEAHVAAFEQEERAGRYVLGGVNVTFQDFYSALARLSGRKAPMLFLPKPMMLFAAAGAKFAFRLLRAQPPVDPKYVEAIVGNYSWYDSSNAAAKLGYHIRPLEESLGEAVQQARTRMVGTHLLNLKAAAAPSPAVADSDDLLLVTGAPGWLGNRLVDVLINGDRAGRTYPPRRVRLLVHPSNRELLKLPPNFEIVYCDITDKAAVRRALDGVRSVFHLAGAIWPSKVETLYRVNVEGTKAVADACVEAGVRRLLYMSTDSTCGHGTKEKRVFDEHTEARPYRDYGQSKRTAEEYLLAKAVAGQLDVTILRGFWFFGPYAPERQLGFLKMFWWPRQIVFGDGRNLRSISHIDNVVDAFLAAEKNTATFGKWYWLGDAEGGRTVDQVYQTVADAVGRPFRPLHVPVLICRMLNVVDLVLSKCGRIQPTIYSAGKFHFDIAGRSDAAMRDFGYTPRATLQDAAREMMEMAPPC